MRTKTVIEGLKNSQKIRVIVKGVAFYTTVYDMAFNLFGDSNIRAAVWTSTEKLASMRRIAKSDGAPIPVGLVYDYNDTQVQVSLV